MHNPEHAPNPNKGPEKLKDFERAPEIIDKSERSPEESPEAVEKKVENARADAEREALASREMHNNDEKKQDIETTQPPFRSRKESFQQTMRHVQTELSTPERAFSKFIHSPPIERVSDALGKTVARPNALLSGSLTACVFVLSLYLLARFYGFELRGSETILAFLLGWAVGIIFDLVRNMLHRHR